jgi:hypothetical protein
MPRFFMPRLTSLAFLLAASFVITAHAEDDTGVTPYRPSVSTPAQLPVPGQLEFELGGLSIHDHGSRRDSLPYQLKLAFSNEWGVLLGGEAYVSQRDGSGARERGVGDTSMVIKRAFIVDDATAFGLELGIKVPTANDVIGSGKTDYGINTIYSRDVGKLHIDVNLNFTRLGISDEGTSRMQTGWSASFSTPLDDHWGANWELSGTRRSGADSTSQFLAALTYSPSKKMTVDVGFAKGLNNATPDWSVFTGIVVPVTKFW